MEQRHTLWDIFVSDWTTPGTRPVAVCIA